MQTGLFRKVLNRPVSTNDRFTLGKEIRLCNLITIQSEGPNFEPGGLASLTLCKILAVFVPAGGRRKNICIHFAPKIRLPQSGHRFYRRHGLLNWRIFLRDAWFPETRIRINRKT